MMVDVSKKPTVVFVHGAWHGPWCWDEHWVDRFVEAGYTVRLVTLDGHDKPGSRQRIWPRMGSYVATVRRVLDELDGEAIAIGHSMGGVVVQRALERSRASAVVLVASVPRRGVIPATLRTLRKAPLATLRTMASLNMRHVVGTATLTRESLFTAATDESVVQANFDRLQNESYLAYVSMMLRWCRPSAVDAPVLVVAGENDGLFTVAEQTRLALAHEGDLIVIDGSGHNLMSDTQWQEAADAVIGWTDRRVASTV